MSDEVEKQIKQRIFDIFPDQATASKIVDLVVNKKPPGWSRHSNAPYYTEDFALQIKKWVDQMIESGSEIVYRWDHFCETDGGVSRNTLYNKINQSLRYLCEQLDPHNIYKEWYNKVNISRTHPVGLRISWREGFEKGHKQDFDPQLVKPNSLKPVWRQKLEQWLESDNKRPFIEDGLLLSPEEILQLKTELVNLAGIQYHITSATIKVIKML